MKRLLILIVSVCILTGCANRKQNVDNAMAMREKLLNASGCSFDATITADYGDKIYTFSMQCLFDKDGNLAFTVKKPDSIAGITGGIAINSGKLTFDDKILAFYLLADGELSPISAPWLLIKTLRSGYLQSVTLDNRRTHLMIDDSYEAESLKVDIWLDDSLLPDTAEIIWQGRKILSVSVENFIYL